MTIKLEKQNNKNGFSMYEVLVRGPRLTGHGNKKTDLKTLVTNNRNRKTSRLNK